MDSKMVDISPSPPFSKKVVISFLISLVTPLTQAHEGDQLYFTGLSVILFPCISKIYLPIGDRRYADLVPRFELWKKFCVYVDLVLRIEPWKKFRVFTRFYNNTRIYIEAVDFVVISYVSLLLVNWSNIWLAIFPLFAIGFIVKLWYELSHQSRSQQCDDDGQGSGHEDVRERNKAEGQEAAALVPYWVLCAMRHYPTADNFAVSQFLLFFSSMMGALTLMMTRLALTGAAPGIAPALVLLQKTSLVVLLVTVHAVAAEILGENFMIFIVPEVAPILLWFSLHLDRREGSFIITADEVKSYKNVITILGAGSAVVFALVAVSKDELLLSWCTKAIVSCGVSGLLVYYVVFMLCQWPGIDSTATAYVEEAVKLLELWANILLVAAALLVFGFVVVVWHGLHEQNVGQLVNKLFLNWELIFQ